MPSWWREHAVEWQRERDNVLLDVHRTLAGIGVDPDVAWRALSRERASVTVAGRGRCRSSGSPARTLHVALHAAHHGIGPSRPIEDLRRAVRTADDGIWRSAAELADELDALLDAFAAGLALDPEGAALAQRLHLPSRVSTGAALRAGSPAPLALGFEQLARRARNPSEGPDHRPQAAASGRLRPPLGPPGGAGPPRAGARLPAAAAVVSAPPRPARALGVVPSATLGPRLARNNGVRRGAVLLCID